jgi:hypothetical protein
MSVSDFYRAEQAAHRRARTALQILLDDAERALRWHSIPSGQRPTTGGRLQGCTVSALRAIAEECRRGLGS